VLGFYLISSEELVIVLIWAMALIN
jgi:hypothetical protein